ncbi:MAG: hypothetical protein CMM58_07965 [Rhodospirillaceae bacterium]|nr:hypothetical protein [Rhodospirillaceae bacterium]
MMELVVDPFMLHNYWRWHMGDFRKLTSAFIDGVSVPEHLLGELTATDLVRSSHQQLQFYLERDGYLFCPGLIDQEDITRARTEVFNRLGEVDELELPYSSGIFSGRSKRDALYPDRGEFWESVSGGKALRKITNGHVLQDAISEIFGSPAVGFDYLFLRAVPSGRFTHLHCDAGFFTRATKQVLTCWIALTNIPLEKGPLFVVEGSHMFKDIKDEFKDFDVDRHKGKKASIEEHPVVFAEQRQARLLTAAFRPGDVLIFGMYTVHGALENHALDSRIRLTCDIRYQPASEPQDPRYFGESPGGTTGAGYGELNGARPLPEDWHIR